MWERHQGREGRVQGLSVRTYTAWSEMFAQCCWKENDRFLMVV